MKQRHEKQQKLADAATLSPRLGIGNYDKVVYGMLMPASATLADDEFYSGVSQMSSQVRTSIFLLVTVAQHDL